MSSAIEVFEKIYENRGDINESDKSYYHIATAAYSAWLGSENVLEKNLAQRLQKIAIDMIVDDINYSYNKTKHSENRPEYNDYFRHLLMILKDLPTQNENLLMKHALGHISLNIKNYLE